MPCCYLHLVEYSLLILNQVYISAAPTVGVQLMLSIPLHYHNNHVIIMYQFGGGYHFVTHLSIDSVPQKHTVSLNGQTAYSGNFGLWQVPLNCGAHKITFDYHIYTSQHCQFCLTKS